MTGKVPARVRRHALIVIALVLATILGLPASRAQAATVTFPDANLEAVVRTQLAIPQPLPVTQSDMLKLTSLHGYSMGIANLGGIEYATNLTTLSLEYNQIADVTPVAGLTKVVFLYLNENQITNITPLAGLTELTELTLGANQITDITPAERLMNLGCLDLSANPITDINPVASLTNLGILGLSGIPITSIAPLAGLTNLTELFLVNNQLTDITPVAGLTNLTYLRLGDNHITDITPVAGLTKLTGLHLEHNDITDITPVAGLTKLTYLDLRYNRLDLTPGSPTMAAIATQVARGATVDYEPQRAACSLTFVTDGTPGASVSTATQTVVGGEDSVPVSAKAPPSHRFVNWTGTDGLVTTSNPLTVTNVTTDATITANFAINTYTLKYAAGANGKISSGATSQIVNHNGSGAAVTASAYAGYHFTGWSDGKTDNPRTDTNVMADVDVTADFAVDTAVTYTLTPSAGPNGSISPNSPQTVNSGASITFTITPDSGYQIEDVLVDGVSVGAVASHTFSGVTANHTISATFSAVDFIPVTSLLVVPGPSAGSALLTWTNPPAPFSKARVLRKIGTVPSVNPNDGDMIYEGPFPTYTDTGLALGTTYVYSVFAASDASPTVWSAATSQTYTFSDDSYVPRPVYRFLNQSLGVHFYTATESEMNFVKNTLSATYTYEGIAYSVSPTATAGAIPVYRFLSKKLPYVHFYTATEAEMTNVKNTMTADWGYEGVAYYVWPAKTGTLTPVWRFFKPKLAVHFYTATESEMLDVKNTMTADYTYEGVAYYVEPYLAP